MVEQAQENNAELYLTFFLGDEMYGLEIMAVQEIIQIIPVAPVPRTPDFVRGVINLRGKIIPVLDLRMRMGMPSCEKTTRTCIVVVEVCVGDRTTAMGIVVDKVAEVLEVLPEQVESPPGLHDSADKTFLTGIGKVDEKVIMLLDIERVLNCDAHTTTAEHRCAI